MISKSEFLALHEGDEILVRMRVKWPAGSDTDYVSASAGLNCGLYAVQFNSIEALCAQDIRVGDLVTIDNKLAKYEVRGFEDDIALLRSDFCVFICHKHRLKRVNAPARQSPKFKTGDKVTFPGATHEWEFIAEADGIAFLKCKEGGVTTKPVQLLRGRA